MRRGIRLRHEHSAFASVAGFFCRLIVVSAALFVGAGGLVVAGAAGVDRATIEAALQGGGVLSSSGGRVVDRATLRALYQRNDFEPIWTEDRIASFSLALQDAASQGLDSSAFSVSSTAPAERELLLTDAFLRYASALARGRVWPGDFETDWRIAAPPFDPKKVLDAARSGEVASALADLLPRDPAYGRLRAALQRYRELAKNGWAPVVSAKPLRLGDHGDKVRQLRERLALEGFAGAAEGVDMALYDDVLAASVSRYQAARGLAVDGVAGRLTLAALDVSAEARVAQIALNLERWRSLPRFGGGLHIEVNVPAASAVLYDDERSLKTMQVIVGAVTHPTPVFRAQMTSVLFNPPWNVPSSILRKEIGPRLQRDPGYLERLGFAFVDGPGGRRLVQLPGPKNALGQLKFEMPNSSDVYMHDTPDRQLFAEPRRAFSHGCIRVEDPRDLARILLDSEKWSRAAIDDAIATGKTQTVLLPHEVPVYVLYWTAFADPDGMVEFRNDLYGRDQKLAAALATQGAMEYLVAAAEQRKC